MTPREPTRDELVRVWARRYSALTPEEAGERFDDFLAVGMLDIAWDDEAGEWAITLKDPQKPH